MLNVRIIARLDVKGQNLVKGVNLEGLRVLGVPEQFSTYYFHSGADELIFMDTVASLYGRNNLEEIVQRTAKNVFIPITVGGGIRSVDDIQRLLRAGADKVAINTAAIQNPDLIAEGARVFGSQCIVLSIEAIKKADGLYEAYTDSGREPTGKDVFEWAKQAVDLGAGEILITSVDQEGTGKGFDLDLVSRMVEDVTVPIIACGGAGKSSDIETVIKCAQANAVCAASIFHYHAIQSFGVQRREEGNVEYLKIAVSKGSTPIKNITPASIRDIKDCLGKNGISCIKSQENIGHSTKSIPGFKKNSFSLKTDPKVLLVDYQGGNLFSVARALKKVGARIEISKDPEKVFGAERVVLAGVGAFGEAMGSLAGSGIAEALKIIVKKGTPILGICLGMQLLMDRGEEFGIHKGLGLIRGKVVSLAKYFNGDGKPKIPHIGWNRIEFPASNGNGNRSFNSEPAWDKNLLMRDIVPGSYAYFVHSYVVKPENQDLIVAETVYDRARFCAIIKKGNLFGCQFHPERSCDTGLQIYSNFLKQS